MMSATRTDLFNCMRCPINIFVNKRKLLQANAISLKCINHFCTKFKNVREACRTFLSYGTLIDLHITSQMLYLTVLTFHFESILVLAFVA